MDTFTNTYIESIPAEPADNSPVKSEIELLREEIAELKDMLAPIGPVLAALPDLMAQVGPLIEGAKKSPVFRMMGITIP